MPSVEERFLSHKLRWYTKISSPKKSPNNTREKILYFFHVCLILPISCWHVTCLLHQLVRLMNEMQSLHHSLFMDVCQNFLVVWLLNHWKWLTDSNVQTFLEEKEKPQFEKKTESYVFIDFCNGISRGWERKLTTGRFATGWF